MTIRFTTLILTFNLLLLINMVGCSKSGSPSSDGLPAGLPAGGTIAGSTAQPHNNRTNTSASPEQQLETEYGIIASAYDTQGQLKAPARCVDDFITAMRKSDEAKIVELLSAESVVQRQKYNVPFGPPQAPGISYEFVNVQMMDQHNARIGTTWTAIDATGKTQAENIAWMARYESVDPQHAGWKIVGMAAIIVPEREPLLINFENIPDTLQRIAALQKTIQEEMALKQKATASTLPQQTAAVPTVTSRAPAAPALPAVAGNTAAAPTVTSRAPAAPALPAVAGNTAAVPTVTSRAPAAPALPAVAGNTAAVPTVTSRAPALPTLPALPGSVNNTAVAPRTSLK